MAENEKKPEWKVILEAKAKAEATRSAKLKAARLARDAALPPPTAKPKSRGAKAKAASSGASAKG